MDSQTPNNSVHPPSAVSEDTAELQARKLDLEIKELSRPWWQKPAYLSVLFPLFVGVLAVIVAYNRGFFDTQTALLELRRERLQRDIDTFTAERERLLTDNKNLRQKNVDLTTERERLLADQKNLRDQTADLTTERERLLADQKNLRDQAASVESQRFALSRQLALITLRGNIKELSNAIGTKDSEHSLIRQALFAGIYGSARNTFYQTIVSELKKNDGHQQDRIKLVSQEVEKHDSQPLFRGFLLTALAEATKDSSWRDKLFQLTIENEFPATGTLGTPFLDLVMQGPFTTTEKASVLVQLAKSVQNRTDVVSAISIPLRMFLIANQDADVLDACVPSLMVDAIRINRDCLLADMNLAITQETEELKLKAVNHFDSSFFLYWRDIAKLSPQAALVYLAQIAVKTGRNMLTRIPLEDSPLSFPTAFETRDVFKSIGLKLLLSPWPEPPFPQQKEIGQLTSQYLAEWLKQNHKSAQVWLDPQLDVISRTPALLKKVNRKQWIEPNEIP